MMDHPFLSKSSYPYGAFPFNTLQLSFYKPAFEKGMEEHRGEIQAILEEKEAPTFSNTILAFEYSGTRLETVSSIFFNLLNAETNDEMQAIAQDIVPQLTKHSNDITLNEALFHRIEQVYKSKETLTLDAESKRLLEHIYKSFIDNGAALSQEGKAKYRTLSTLLSTATLSFQENTLNELNAYSLLIEHDEELKGVPEAIKESLQEEAKSKGKTGFLLTLRTTCFAPILKYADSRPLREKLYKAFTRQCLGTSPFSNVKNILTIINARLELAHLFGYDNYADYTLQDKMAKNKEKVYDLLEELTTAYKPKAKQEIEQLQNYAKTLGADFSLQAWDYSYYNNKLKEKIFQTNEQNLRPFFELSRVIKGVFGLAHTLYGLSFTPREDIPVYHPDVKVFEVKDGDESPIGLLYTDFYPREGKSSGAWMTNFKEQYKDESGLNHRPHVSIVMNFSKPTATKPSLLLFSEVGTFLHEFGHALHALLSNCHYQSLSGTNVYRDFVELPSQLMENWLYQSEFLNSFAQHYLTHEKLPMEEIEKLKKAKNFSVGYNCWRQLSFGLQDMAFHTITNTKDEDFSPIAFEIEATKSVRLYPQAPDTGRCTTFGHIFSGGYAAGYYSYKWAEVLDADAFSLFEEKGIMNQEVAMKFRHEILEKGNTEDPLTLFENFRGRAPQIQALLKKEGIQQ